MLEISTGTSTIDQGLTTKILRNIIILTLVVLYHIVGEMEGKGRIETFNKIALLALKREPF
ncbi:MAG: hypothetical protein CVV02_10470 [Firmicutes bacterium HGW-Firmicutes-7]|nr:MAG: hypothetical protein CVV02_10470 [Firmicutes bacterium HGW-Firmicutes-7]